MTTKLCPAVEKIKMEYAESPRMALIQGANLQAEFDFEEYKKLMKTCTKLIEEKIQSEERVKNAIQNSITYAEINNTEIKLVYLPKLLKELGIEQEEKEK